jgi:hypothetical protein
MITGRTSGSGKYSYHERHSGNRSVMVSHMTDDGHSTRIAFRHNGEINIPILKLDDSQAEMLWAALSAMAKDRDWKDYYNSK